MLPIGGSGSQETSECQRSPATRLTLLDKTRGTPLDVRALGGIDASSLALLTTSPGARAIADLTPADRVALPAVKVSQQAVLLQIAAEKLWGPGQHERLDTITLSLPHSEAVPALLSSAGGITAHFSNEPFQTKELRDPRVRVLATSYDILGGPATVSALYGTSRFRDANPGVNRFVFEALAEAQALIARDRTRALGSCWPPSLGWGARRTSGSCWPPRP
jgi:NitT/TauT family transport system substrate-binding protein